jgi:class 3 adenylate cyclase
MGRLIMFDPLGTGASDPVPLGGLPTPEKWIDDLRIVLDTTGSTSTVIVSCNIYGVMAMFFAATYPERTKALVLIDSFARWLGADDYPSEATQETLETVLHVFRDSWGKGIGTAMNTPSRAKDPSFLRWLARTERMGASPTEITAYWAWGMTLDVRQVLPVIGVPTLVMYNDPNYLIPGIHSRYLAEHIRGARYVELNRRDSYLMKRQEGDRVLDHVEEFITGAPPTREPDRVLTTVLFTDIVSSTEHASRLGDRPWAELLDRHDEILVLELNRHKGHKVAPTGDGLFATFDGPVKAIRCAHAICDSVRPLGIEVRAGVHIGEVQRRGDGVDGLAVNIGQRVSALAGPGEVLVSSAARNLAAGSGIQFTDRGAHVLKGVPNEWQLYRADA